MINSSYSLTGELVYFYLLSLYPVFCFPNFSKSKSYWKFQKRNSTLKFFWTSASFSPHYNNISNNIHSKQRYAEFPVYLHPPFNMSFQMPIGLLLLSYLVWLLPIYRTAVSWQHRNICN